MANGTWRIARQRGSAHLPLIIVAALAVALILIGKAQSSLFDRARAGFIDWMRPALVASQKPMENIDNWIGSIGEIFDVYEENLKLKQENARLRQWRSTAIVLDNRLKRYQLLLHAVPDPALSSIVARVIGRASQPFIQTMILDAGKKNGVKPGEAVVDSRGMIGRIFLTGERTSWVILLTDLNSRIPVTVEPNTTQAIMAGDNSPVPALEALPQINRVKAGDQVVSSGDGGILPAGLPIGVVVKDGEHFRVALFADSATAQDVEVLDFKHPPEQLPAMAPGDLPVTAAGLPPAPPPQEGVTVSAPLVGPLGTPAAPPGGAAAASGGTAPATAPGRLPVTGKPPAAKPAANAAGTGTPPAVEPSEAGD